jgi:hypothetical protein
MNNKNIKTTTATNDNYYIKTYGMTEKEVLNAIKGLQGKERSEELRFMMIANNIEITGNTYKMK